MPTPVAVAERSNPVRAAETVGMSPTNDPMAASAAQVAVDPAGVPAQVVEVPLGLEGYCPVVLSKEERWIPGNPAFFVMYRGLIYRFSSKEAMEQFSAAPLKFAPVAMGEDIVLMVQRNKKSYGTRKYGAWYEGRVYLFSTQETLDSFASNPEYYAEIAQKYETAFKSPLDSVQR